MDAIIRRLVFQIDWRTNVLGILLTGSTATRRAYQAYDDFDVVVFTKSRCARKTHYRIINSSRKPYLISIYFVHLGNARPKRRNVLHQRDVRVLFGRKQTLRCLLIERPRKIEPEPSRLPNFARWQERYWEIFVDCVFILKRSERRGFQHRTKARLARQAIRTISKHFHARYHRAFAHTKRMAWKSVVRELTQLLSEKQFPVGCRNPQLFKDFQSLASTLSTS
ncbi:MAG: hypothetical protein ABSD58_16845 [Verrucomicrobiia bacterium]|jgi:hypothetical protein